VLHTASPYVLNTADPQKDLADPALKGTKNVLTSCKKAGVKQVILTSSVAAVTDSPEPDHKYTEADWNKTSSLTRNPYYYSKTVAEKAAWDFAKQNHLNLLVINPFVVVGPSLEKRRVNPSNLPIKDIMTGGFPGIIDLAWGMVDVRDVAQAHLLVMENNAATGRYILWNKTLHMRECCKIVEKYYPDYPIPKVDLSSKFGSAIVYLGSYLQPKGTGTYVRTNLGSFPLLDNSKIRDLGMKFTPIETTILDTCTDMLSKKLVGPPGPVKKKGGIVWLILVLLLCPLLVWMLFFRGQSRL